MFIFGLFRFVFGLFFCMEGLIWVDWTSEAEARVPEKFNHGWTSAFAKASADKRMNTDCPDQEGTRPKPFSSFQRPFRARG